MSALQNTVRFLVIHGASDDNVHIQNTLTLIVNWTSRAMVYERLSSWLVNAFNGEWHRITNPVPDESMWEKL
ncbi:hypothetical protein BDV12DRAFT_203483 [Aspergillus spectabilis]